MKARELNGKEVMGNAVIRMMDENGLKGADRNEEAGTITFDIKQYDAFLEIIKEEIDEALAQAQKQAAHTAFRVF